MSLLLTCMNAPRLHNRHAAHKDCFRWLLGIVASAAFGGALAVAMSPDALVAETVREVQKIIRQDPELQAGNKQKTLDLVEKKILPHFDFERMTMLAVGKDWARANPEQRQSLVNGFRSLLVRTYSGALAVYKHHKIEVKPTKADAADNVVVRSQVSAPGAPPVLMDYRMHRTTDGWKVQDVAVEGVSLVTTFRSSFKSEIDRGGFDGLIKLISDKNGAGTGTSANPGAAAPDKKR